MAQLDEATLARVLPFIQDVQCRLCCREWSNHIFVSLQLVNRMRFHKHVRENGVVSYYHGGVRSFGEDFEECVAYSFEFFESGTYHLQWTRGFGQWSAANERQIGVWWVQGSNVCCKSRDGPEVADGCVRYAPAGRVFELDVDGVLSGNTVADGTALVWEFHIRGSPVPCFHDATNERSPDLDHHVRSIPAPLSLRSDARFVEIDGDVLEVSGDIKANYPESDWQRLMRCRARFGLLGHQT
uniref:Uncharacterized protein n=1 Tax=Noctiluca scintillans TaxID=2966 RepID=A0A7S1B1U8_NOCSC